MVIQVEKRIHDAWRRQVIWAQQEEFPDITMVASMERALVAEQQRLVAEVGMAPKTWNPVARRGRAPQLVTEEEKAFRAGEARKNLHQRLKIRMIPVPGEEGSK